MSSSSTKNEILFTIPEIQSTPASQYEIQNEMSMVSFMKQNL
jgi:hypothetical protein